MLKLKLTKAEHEALPDAIKPEYKASGDSFELDTDVKYEDVSALKNALMDEKKHRKTATEKVTELTTEVETLKTRAGNATDLEKSWTEKLDKAKKDFEAKEVGLKQQLTSVLVDEQALKLATEISTAPELLLPHIKSRLKIEEEDGKLLVRVLDAEGKASADSVKDLRDKIVADKRFSPIITGSSASGGGASGSSNLPSGGKKFADMTETEKVALHDSDKAKFDKLAAEASATQ